jgi:hypothetical protein
VLASESRPRMSLSASETSQNSTQGTGERCSLVARIASGGKTSLVTMIIHSRNSIAALRAREGSDNNDPNRHLKRFTSAVCNNPPQSNIINDHSPWV